MDMKNIKRYQDHLREANEAPVVRYREYTGKGRPLYQMPWAPSGMWSPTTSNVTNAIIVAARKVLSEKQGESKGPFTFDPGWHSAISLATETETPEKDLDLRLSFHPFPNTDGGIQDQMDVFLSSFGILGKGWAWVSKGTLPFSVRELGRILTGITGEPLENTEANGRALASIISDAVKEIEVFLGDRLEKIKKTKRSRGAFGRF
jgi:hypothetical protein